MQLYECEHHSYTLHVSHSRRPNGHHLVLIASGKNIILGARVDITDY